MEAAQKTYNGWTNYATWGVALVLDNDPGTYQEADERARMYVREAPEHRNVETGIWTPAQAAQFDMADWLKEWTEELCGLGDEYDLPEPTMLARQLLQAALAEVDWDEIANHYLAEHIGTLSTDEEG